MNYNSREMINTNLNKYTQGVEPMLQSERHERSPIPAPVHVNGLIDPFNRSYDQPIRHFYPNHNMSPFNSGSQFVNYPRFIAHG